MMRLVDDVTLFYQGAFIDRGFGDELEGDVAVARPGQPVLKNRLALLKIWIKLADRPFERRTTKDLSEW